MYLGTSPLMSTGSASLRETLQRLVFGAGGSLPTNWSDKRAVLAWIKARAKEGGEGMERFRYEAMPTALKGDKDIAMAIAGVAPAMLARFPSQIRDDLEIAARAVATSATSLGLFSERVRNTRDVYMSAASVSTKAAFMGSENLRSDPFVARAVVQNNPLALAAFSNTIRSSFDVAMEAVRVRPMALGACSDAIRDDPQIVAFAAKRDPRALMYASPRLWCVPQFIADNLPSDASAASAVIKSMAARLGDGATAALIENPIVAGIVAKRVKRDGMPAKTGAVLEKAFAAAHRPAFAPTH